MIFKYYGPGSSCIQDLGLDCLGTISMTTNNAFDMRSELCFLSTNRLNLFQFLILIGIDVSCWIN